MSLTDFIAMADGVLDSFCGSHTFSVVLSTGTTFLSWDLGSFFVVMFCGLVTMAFLLFVIFSVSLVLAVLNKRKEGKQ